jgi:hypothetical protein
MKRCAPAILFAIIIMFVPASTSTAKDLCQGFLPPNEMKIPVGAHPVGIRNNGGLNEQQYNSVMDRIQAMYGHIVARKGGTLVINRLWTDATVNSSAQQVGNQWIINMYGGIARHPDTTFEGEALIACHEMGHHLGGAPKLFGDSWATNEGGADYFSTLKCLRGFFEPDDNAAIIANVNIDPLAKSQCEAQFQAKKDQDICKRLSMGAESVSYLFQALNEETTRPQFGTPDKTEVADTNDDHPATQCRMDTYFGGSLCPVAASVPNSNSDFKTGSCVQGVDPVGYRSRCWFNPESTGEKCPLDSKEDCDQLCEIDPTLSFCQK